MGTWNVGNAPPDEDLSSWLDPEEMDGADIIAIGAQECEFKTSSPDTSCQDEWIHALSLAIGDSHVLVRADSLGQMRLAIWAKMATVAGISAHSSDGVATGIGNVMANKGGVATAIWIWNTSVVFVNSHLAAHQNETKRRNMDYSNIVGGLELASHVACDILQEFEHVVWMGDLNYRLDLPESVFGEGCNAKENPPAELFSTIKTMVAQEQVSKLIEHDQLFNARIDVQQIDTCAARVRDGLVAFVGFRESDISFAPTFKVLRQAQTEYTTQRSPAYCDRVMWRSSPYLSVECTRYWSGECVASSDHKPVAAMLDLEHRYVYMCVCV